MADNDTTYKFAQESMMFGKNDSISTNMSPEKMAPDAIFNAVGLYSKQDIEIAKFSKFSRFGRILDPYGRVNPGREFLFFVKPDLHICKSVKPEDDDYTVYNISGGDSNIKSIDGSNLTLNPQLAGHNYFKDLIYRRPNVIKELQISADASDDPFSHLLSFSVNSNLPLDSSTAKTMDNPATIFGTSYNYLQDSEASDEAYSFSLEFVDDKDLNVYHFFKAYSEYHIARKSGLVTPPSMKYYQQKRLHNTMGIYKFIVGEDGETILYWAYLWGVIPTSCPREAFQDPSFTDGLTFSVNFEAAFIEDMNPYILHQFNRTMLMKSGATGIDVNNWIPIVRRNSGTYYDQTYKYTHPGYDQSIDIPGNGTKINGIPVNIGFSEITDGTLPSTALVDGRIIDNEKPKYRLRWYK